MTDFLSIPQMIENGWMRTSRPTDLACIKCQALEGEKCKGGVMHAERLTMTRRWFSLMRSLEDAPTAKEHYISEMFGDAVERMTTQALTREFHHLEVLEARMRTAAERYRSRR